MSEIKYANINQVIEQFDYNVVNKYLAEGWVLITTYTTTAYDTVPENQTIHFVLGFPTV